MTVPTAELDASPDASPGDAGSVATPWGFVVGLLRPHRRSTAAYGAVLALATVIPLVGSLLLARFVERAVGGAPVGDLAALAAGYAFTGLVASVLNVAVIWQATSLAWQITDQLRRDLAAKVLGGDLAFHRDHTPGELVTRVDADVTAMTQFLSQVVARVIGICALAVAALVVLTVVQWRLAPALAVGVAAIGLVTFAQRNSGNDVTAAERQAEAEVMSVAEQYLAGAEDVATLGAGAHGIARIARESDRLARRVGRRTWTQMRVQGAIRVTIIAAEVLMLAVGAVLAGRGALGIGAVFLGFRFVVVVRQPVEGLTWRMQEAQGAAGAARRVLDLVRERGVIPDGTRDLPGGPLAVHIEHVTLAYDDRTEGERAAVVDVDLLVPAGRVLGLIGRTGSGKTSLGRLALRLVQPSNGRVVVGGVDLAEVAETSLRRRVAAVPQDVQLFPGTVADNVALFGVVDRGAVVRALEAVGLGPWLAAQPDGVDTVLAGDDRGEADAAGLSAGEAQLLALARAMLRDPGLVVLDEATSRVDPGTQAMIAAATDELLRGRTGIVIAHRLETLEVCDDIAVLVDGHLVEHGPRVALAADAGSSYARLLRTAATGVLS